jgi:hypothetical protein
MLLWAFAILGWMVATGIFAVLCVVAAAAVKTKSAVDEEIARLQAELSATPKNRDGFDYDRLAAAMARHNITLTELRSSRAKAGLDSHPVGRFGEHET